MLIKVLGSGCPSCKSLYESVKNVVGDDKDIKVEYITDINVLLEAGIMASPALLIDESLMSVGRVPSIEEIRDYVEARKNKDNTVSSDCSCGGCC